MATYPTLQPIQAIDQHTAGSATSTTTSAITTTPGNLLVVMVFCFGNHIGATPVTDSKSNTWTAAIASTGTTKGWAAMFYAANCLGGSSHTFTFTATASDFLDMVVVEIPGTLKSSVLGSTSTSTTAGTTHDSGNITAGSAAPEIFIGGLALSAAAETTTVTSQFWGLLTTNVASATTEGSMCFYRVVPAGTTAKYTTSNSSNQNETIMIAGFIAAAEALAPIDVAYVG